MAKRSRSAPEQQLPAALQAASLHAAGIDVGSEEHWVAVPADADPHPVRPFPAHTAGRDDAHSGDDNSLHRLP